MITDLGVLRPDPATCELVLTGIYPGGSVAEIKNRTGWDLQVSADLEQIQPPTEDELTVLRRLVATMPARKPAPTGAAR